MTLQTEKSTAFGEEIFCRTAPGPADKVLWIHGYTMDSSLWQPLWERLPGWFHMGIDLPFHGESPPKAAHYTMPSFAQLLGELALKHGVKHLVGLSLGAILTLQIATEFPESFLSVTLGSAGINGGPNDPHAGPHYKRLFALFQQRGPGPWMTELWMQSPPEIFKGAAAHPALWRSISQVINHHAWGEFSSPFIARLTAHSQMKNLDQIGQIRMPTMLVIGEGEMPSFKRASGILQETIPNCHQVWLPDAGHLCLLERPQSSAELIAAHLAQYAEIQP